EAARLLSVDNAGFRLLDGDELVLAGLAGTAAETMVRPRLKVGESLSGQVVASGRPLNCELADVRDVGHEHLAARRRLGYATLLRARSSCLYRLDPATGGLAAVTVSGGAGASFHWSPALASGTGIAGLAVSERRAVATDDALADPRITYAEDVRARVAGETHRALLAVPLLGQDRLLGALVVSDRAGRRFDEPETGLAQAFADQAALALENARLYYEAREH